MAMEITMEKQKDDDHEYDYDGYTLYVGDHRILTLSTECDRTCNKWLNHALKTHRNNKHHSLLVGVSVERQNNSYGRNGLDDTPYDLLSLCIGSHCLVYRLPQPDYYSTPKSLQTFFSNPNVLAVGMDMLSAAKKLCFAHSIKFANPVNLNTMAMKGLKREDLDLGRYDLDKLGKAVLGKHWDVVRPEKVEWYLFRPWDYIGLRAEKVKFATVDAFFCYRIGSELLDMLNGSYPLPSYLKNKKKNKNKK